MMTRPTKDQVTEVLSECLDKADVLFDVWDDEEAAIALQGMETVDGDSARDVLIALIEALGKDEVYNLVFPE